MSVDPEHLTRLAAEAIWASDGRSLESLHAIAESGSVLALLQDRCFDQARAAVGVVLKEMGNV